MRAVNVTTCELGTGWQRGEFRCTAFQLAAPLGASVIGATVYEMRAADKLGQIDDYWDGEPGAGTA